MGSSDDAPFCAEALVADAADGPSKNGRWRVCTNRLECGEKRSGYDVSSARGWMEHIEHIDGSECGVGAYTVLRCDALYDQHECQWRVWGWEFHLGRLCSSFKMLVESIGDEQCSFEEAMVQTDDVTAALLEEAGKSFRHSIEGHSDETHTRADGDGKFARTLMLTILWTPPETEKLASKRSRIRPTVRGHAAFVGGTSPARTGEEIMPPPVAACLGIPDDVTLEALKSLPRRYSDNERDQLVGPSAKISSWCRERRPLEDPSRYKPPGSCVGEVLLVRQGGPIDTENDQSFIDCLEILEGLTSNLFVIYKDGTVRTAPAGKVLSGYARQLVVDELNATPSDNSLKKLTLDGVNAPTVRDARNGLWSEVFITSSIRLIVPVNRVVIPPVRGMDSVILWKSDSDSYPLTRSLWTAVRKRGYKSATPR